MAPAHAQTAGAPAVTPQAVPARQPYQDRVMEGVTPLKDEDQAAEYSSSGWPRGLSLQLTRNLQTSENATADPARANTRNDTQGVQLDAYLETPNFGFLSIHALALGGRGSTGLSSWSIRQTAMPFDGGWRADNALGTTNLLVPELSRRNSRLALPMAQVLGGSTVWRNESAQAMIFGASVGEPGRFEGFPQSRFTGLGGRVSSVFGQLAEGDQTMAFAVARGDSILPEVAPVTDNDVNDGPARINPRGFYVSAARGNPFVGASWQISAIGSKNAGLNATGIWADATWRDGAQSHQASIFRFTQGLTWIDRPLAADLQGGSYRYDFRSLRWDVSANIESFSSVSGQSPGGWYASGSGRRRLSAVLSSGGGFAFRNFGLTSGSGFGYVQWQNAMGVSRLQVDAAATQNSQSSQAVTVDHSIYAENGLSLSTSISAERLRPAGTSTTTEPPRPSQNAFTMALTGRALLGNSLSVQGSVRARDVKGNAVGSGTSVAANVSVDWQISRDWSLGASLYENRGAPVELFDVQSPLVVPEFIRTRPSDHGVFLTLRYATRAGTPSIPLGGAPGSGAGRIEGSVFLDSNGNGQREASESGAANVLVILDGKFSIRTNAYGGFEFPNVVSGPHNLTVLPDDLPLPWTLDTEQKIMAPVSTRSSTRVDIGAKRMR